MMCYERIFSAVTLPDFLRRALAASGDHVRAIEKLTAAVATFVKIEEVPCTPKPEPWTLNPEP
jgi:hypothetical protein